MGLIELKGMKFYAFHGHFESERKIGNKFSVNVRIETDCELASETDDLNNALDYRLVYDIVKTEMSVPSLLLENVAKRILDNLLDHFSSVKKVKVKISKLNPPLGGEIDKVSVTITR